MENASNKILLPSISELDAWLKRREASIPGIIPGTEKIIYWAHGAGKKTPFSIVYIHGFTASRQETAPVFDNIAKKIKANLFYTRLKGHGRDGEALKEAKLKDWLYDACEAYTIGNAIGNKVILVGCSTGAPLVTWLAADNKNSAALIILSPNFGVADKNANLLLLPGGRLLARMILGKYYTQFEPVNELHGKYWTPRYRSQALHSMMKTVNQIKKIDLESIKLPVLCVYTENDTALSIPDIIRVFELLGSERKSIVNLREALDHVLAGDIVSPDTNKKLVSLVMDFLENQVLQK
jgi:esterase/lipase